MKSKYNIGISCIGSGVGQSVIDSCNLSKLPIKTFGFGNNPFAFGLYNCHEYYYTPDIYSSNYLDVIFDLCKKHKIDLWIPGLDDEANLIAKNIKIFNQNNIRVVVAGSELLDLCRDKKLMSTKLNTVNNIFVRSFNKENFHEAYSKGEIKLPVISKPRDGFASRGIKIIASENDFRKIKDNHIVQELAVPSSTCKQREFFDLQIQKNINPQVAEISIQIVANKNGDIIGKMMSHNKLNNGIPIEIVPYYNNDIWLEVEKIIPTLKTLGLRGPLNLQGRLTDDGLKLFEMNARFTGITGLRAVMGFNEVEACIVDWLDIPQYKNNLQINPKKFGIRQTQDKTVSLAYNSEVLSISKTLNNQNNLHTPKKIFITGATGYLGRNLIRTLIEKNQKHYNVWAYVRDKQKAKEIFPLNSVTLFDHDDFISGNIPFGQIDTLLHAGFARSYRSNEEIAKSIEFTNILFLNAVKHQVPEIINISSQGVYGQTKIPWKENNNIAPETIYATAKYSTEVLLTNLCQIHPHIQFTNIRLEALSGGADGFDENDLFAKLIKKTLHSEKIDLYGGNQKMVRMDIRDAVSGLILLLSTDSKNWKQVYNLGNGINKKLKEISEIIVTVSKDYIENEVSEINIIDNNRKMEFGMDVNQFKNDMNWKAEYNMEDTIRSIFDYLVKK
ncbi:MAG: NAD-dependent epimerase/dehydratase family protein [Flavobacteriaceae bacterium]|nr:NAD-dependent epimerase/dehydratase family protein [Flavobacteriaceae bacterium]